MMEKIIRWIIYGVAIALLPLIFQLIILIASGAKASLVAVTSQGELLLISVCMVAAAIGEIIICDTNKKKFKMISVGSCLLLLIMSALLFAVISQSNPLSISLDNNAISDISLYLYFCSLISSGCCVYLSGVTT